MSVLLPFISFTHHSFVTHISPAQSNACELSVFPVTTIRRLSAQLINIWFAPAAPRSPHPTCMQNHFSEFADQALRL
jgi:hypothetical protein